MALAARYLIRSLPLWLAALATAGTMRLEDANARSEPELRPLHEGISITVQGYVSFPAVSFGDYAHLAITDEQGFGLVVEAPRYMFEGVSPGDRLEIRGMIAERNGLVVLRPQQITTSGNFPPPRASLKRVEELQSLQALGQTAIIEGKVVALGEDPKGTYLLLDDRQAVSYPVYLPKAASTSKLAGIQVGDRVRVTGIASQWAAQPPFSSGFRMVIPNAASVSLLRRGWPVPANAMLAITFSCGGMLLWWWRAWRLARKRGQRIRRFHSLAEDLLSASNEDEVLRKLSAELPKTADLDVVRWFRPGRTEHSLELVRPGEPWTIGGVLSIDPKPDAEDREIELIAMSYRNRTPLHIPDSRRSILLRPNSDRPLRSLIAIPVMAREEWVGLLSLSDANRTCPFSQAELLALQHVGNQAATILKLIEGQRRKEQLSRSEKLAATGQIIKGVTSELTPPLESIVALARKLLESGSSDARLIVNESMRASAVLSRLTLVAREEQDEAQTIDMNQIAAQAVDSCRAEWHELDVRLGVWMHPAPLWVLGSAEQLRHAMRNLIFLSARASLESAEPEVRVQCSSMARRVTIAIDYESSVCSENFPVFARSGEDVGALGFAVCRGILQGNGGDLKLHRAGKNLCRMEITLPEAFPANGGEYAGPRGKDSGRALTAILLEPDSGVQRRLVSVWAGHGHRAMPIANEAEALELTKRLKVDVVFSAVRVGQTDWLEIFERVRERVPAFVLLTEGLESDASTLFPDGGGFVLRKPVEPAEIVRLMERIGARLETEVRV